MKRVKKEVLKSSAFYPKYLKLINVILPDPLTQREIDVLSAFMGLKGDLVELDRFGTQARTVVRKRLGFKTHSNLDNYIKYFKNKGVLVLNPKTKQLELNKRIEIPKNEKEISLAFVFKIKDHE
jgi:hypothetical protein